MLIASMLSMNRSIRKYSVMRIVPNLTLATLAFFCILCNGTPIDNATSPIVIKEGGYIKFPFTKIYDISEKGTGLFRRDSFLNAPITNEQVLYVVSLEIGTPSQEVFVQVDTGSSDLYVIDPANPYCQSNYDAYSDSSSLEDTVNVATESRSLEANATSSADASQPTSCSYWGVFSPDQSSTFKKNATIFNATYGDNTFANGFYGTDVVIMGGAKLENVSFGVTDNSSNTYGVMGINLPEYEFSDEENVTYSNIPQILKQQGKIKKVTYSLFLNETDAEFGSLLFGGVDSSKYSGQLYTLPILKDFLYHDVEYGGMFVTLQGVGYRDGPKVKTLTQSRLPVLLDSGTTVIILPKDLANFIGKEYGSERYDKDQQGYVIKCSSSNSSSLLFDFGGFTIINNLTNYISYYEGDKCILNIVKAEGSGTPPILGDYFLRDAYVVYDLENLEVSLAQASYDGEEEEVHEIVSDIPNAQRADGYSSIWSSDDKFSIGGSMFASSTDSTRTTIGTATSSVQESKKNGGSKAMRSSCFYLFSTILYSILA